ncbi:MAG TPA: hypothetical protein VKO84_09530 [Gaiellaceae bacterium]|nr:hypothetical protein [Gaiellaceae bacterium]
MRRLVVLGASLVAALALAGVAYADSCANVSRAPAACGMSCTSPVFEGNWVWLPSIGIPEPAWGFSPPGSVTSQEIGLPNANGNYLDQSGNASWLLENSAICAGNVPNRQTAHGIQSGCGA